MSEMPIIPDAAEVAAPGCTLPQGETARRMGEVRAFMERATERVATDDGALLRFAGDDEAARLPLDFVLFERRCCAALTYELVSEPPHDGVALRVRGGEGHAALARALAGVA